jgi:two-component system, NarL family, response regulator NreC
MMTVLLADDHAVARFCLASLIKGDASLSLVAEATDGFEAVRLANQLRPDVLLTAFAMPGLAGLEVARQVRARAPETKAILFAAPLHESYVVEAMRLDVAGYVLRSAGPKELLRAVHETAAGRRYISPPLSTRAIAAQLKKAAAQPAEPYESLTRREREVLRLAAEGLSNAKIADRLGISRRTAEAHRANLLGKLGLENQTELILYALRRGVLPLEWDRGPSSSARAKPRSRRR